MAAKVLLVEDDNNLREIYEARLKAEGYDIVSAQDGEEALVVAKSEKPDLIISDVMMPKISGFEMLDILRNTDGLKDVKIIMLTALGQAEDKTRADKLGANKYLVKSQVTLEDIVTTAHQLLDDAPAAAAVEPAAPGPAASTPSASPTPAAAPTATTIPVATAPEPAAAPTSTAIPVTAAPPEPTAPPTPPTSASPAPAPSTPTPTPVATPAPTTSSPQTTAQEEAALKSQIENFVQSTPANQTSTPAPSTTADQAMQDAVNDMIASTQPPASAPTPSSVEAVEVPPEQPATPSPAPATEDKPQNDSVTIAHKKIIQPIESEPKADLNTLLAAEEAKTSVATPNEPVVSMPESTAAAPAAESATPPVPPAPSGTVINPTEPPAASSSSNGSGFDPNNIAL